MLRILVAPDSFKDSLQAPAAASAIRKGIAAFDKNIKVACLPLSDGGEGFASLLTKQNGGKLVSCKVHDPIGRPIFCSYGWKETTKTAWVDVASASGIERLHPKERNPLMTSSYGTGELLNKALQKGATTIFIGLGGSATIDMGCGMAGALGYTFRDSLGKKLPAATLSGRHLKHVASIHSPVSSAKRKQIEAVRFVACADVDNPLIGSKGAVYTYGRQKGADSNDLIKLEEGMKHMYNHHLHSLLKMNHGPVKALKTIAGTGAAGGIGAGSIYFLKAALRVGAEVFFEQVHLYREIQKADLIITGEGKIENQFFHGKLLHRLSAIARLHQKPIVALVGCMQLQSNQRQRIPLDYITSILPGPMLLADAMDMTKTMLTHKAYEVCRLWCKKNNV